MWRSKAAVHSFAPRLSEAPVELDCKIAVLMEMPAVVSAEDSYYPRRSVDRGIVPAAAMPRALDKHQQRSFWIETVSQCPHWPGISWMY
ncbi:MAG: hypothetical protein A3G25_21770 [Betaproteobacteria bacterium RIFCSPLOWO2_12_FULL_63_13]|nr:MAG: hypothetical protein A3H32_11275 [Betaproteobacteria bacterium RIFCSPLOWO2_02_FULL_63_19]OGA51851.1 MAG: hypothetical protein A3G25_21770 [Betaproteobacteria bacterium RIFCSPLOWO2_12_FULL_63_13]